MSTLEQALATYDALLPTLKADEGKFALIAGDQLLGTFVSYEDALQIGYQHCGLSPFLVKRIEFDASMAFFSRDLTVTCPASI